MKKRFLLLLAYALCAYAPPAIVLADPARPFLPLSPAGLITYLPPAPKGWMVTRSTAENIFTTWIETRAERDFKRPPPPLPPGAPPAPPAPIVTMNVSLLDTGYMTDFKDSFLPPQSGKLPDHVTLLKINNFPARKQVLDEVTTVLSILIKDRYVVEIRARNLPDEDLQTYATAFDFTKLLSTPDTGETKLPIPVIITEVDELHPEKNRSYAIHWASPKDH